MNNFRNIAINEYIYNKIKWKICIEKVQNNLNKCLSPRISGCTFINDGTVYYLQNRCQIVLRCQEYTAFA